MTYYKAARPNGTDFRTGKIQYAVGETVYHPTSRTYRKAEQTFVEWSMRRELAEAHGGPRSRRQERKT